MRREGEGGRLRERGGGQGKILSNEAETVGKLEHESTYMVQLS